jgi:hypothetical protein
MLNGRERHPRDALTIHCPPSCNSRLAEGTRQGSRKLCLSLRLSAARTCSEQHRHAPANPRGSSHSSQAVNPTLSLSVHSQGRKVFRDADAIPGSAALARCRRIRVARGSSVVAVVAFVSLSGRSAVGRRHECAACGFPISAGAPTRTRDDANPARARWKPATQRISFAWTMTEVRR